MTREKKSNRILLAMRARSLMLNNGQAIVKRVLYGAIESELASNVVIRRKTTMTEYRLAQVADYFCTIELAALKYTAGEAGKRTTSSLVVLVPSSAIGLSRHGESVFDGATMPPGIEFPTSVDSFLARLIWVVPSCSATPISSRWCCATYGWTDLAETCGMPVLRR